MELQILKPVHETIDIQSTILYTSSDRAWNVIRLKKPILDEFPQLKEKRAKFFYKMIHHNNYKELEKAVRKMKRNKETVPILLFFYKAKQEIPN
jgi:hypothetical protein